MIAPGISDEFNNELLDWDMLHTAAERLNLISINLNFLVVKDDCQSGRLKISHNIVGGKKKKKKM